MVTTLKQTSQLQNLFNNNQSAQSLEYDKCQPKWSQYNYYQKQAFDEFS